MENINSIADESKFQYILSRFKKVKRLGNGSFQAECPAHEDHNPSLSITPTPEKILFHCHAGCSSDAIAHAVNLDMKELFLDGGNGTGKRPDRVKVPNEKKEIAKTYNYTDASGNLLYQAVRYKPKSFAQRRPDGKGGWIWDMQGVRRVLYNLPEVLKGIAQDEPIFIVEGEKDVETLRHHGLIATCNVGGAGKWKPEYSDTLKGARAVIIPDNDKAGREHAQRVAESLYGKASSVKILTLSGLPEKGDVSDWLESGNDIKSLTRLSDDAPEYVPAPDPDPKSEIKSFELSDAGNAECFANMYKEVLKYDHRRGQWLIFREGLWWEPDATGEVLEMAIKTARQRKIDGAQIADPDKTRKAFSWALSSAMEPKLRAMLNIAKSIPLLADKGDGWDSGKELLGVKNGVVNLRTGELRAGLPEDKIKRHTNVPYTINANEWSGSSHWGRFLGDVFVGNDGKPDLALIAFLHNAVGYSITGLNKEQYFFLCHGKGANGKSVFLNTLHCVFGDYAYNAPFSTFELSGRASIPNDIAALHNRRLVISSETNDGVRLNEARLKGLTGGDKQTARYLNHEFFEFTPECKIWLAVNHKPRIQDDSYGFWRRVLMIEFRRLFDTDADNGLSEKLKAEASDILAWAVKGAMIYFRDGLNPPASVQSAVKEYESESDPLRDFLTECCAIGESCHVKAKDFYKAYTVWCNEQGMKEKETMTITLFGRKMKERYRKKSNGKGILYYGIGLKNGLSSNNY